MRIGSIDIEMFAPCCYQCGDFPCRLIRNLEKSYNSRYEESLVENSEIVREEGICNFLKIHSARYTCMECGGIVSLHDKVCTECGKRTR